jgi:hypothetical protein
MLNLESEPLTLPFLLDRTGTAPIAVEQAGILDHNYCGFSTVNSPLSSTFLGVLKGKQNKK